MRVENIVWNTEDKNISYKHLPREVYIVGDIAEKNVEDALFAEFGYRAQSFSVEETPLTREEKLCIIFDAYHIDLYDEDNARMIDFYVDSFRKHRSLRNADGYAWLCTLFGYDLGQKVANDITDVLSEMYDMSVFELDNGSKDHLISLCEIYSIPAYFGKFVAENSETPETNYDWYKVESDS